MSFWKSRTGIWNGLLAVALLAVLLCGLDVYRDQEHRYRERVENNLREVFRNKGILYELWCKERQGDGVFLSSQPQLGQRAARYLTAADEADRKYLDTQLGQLVEVGYYNQVWLLDTGGRPRYSTTEGVLPAALADAGEVAGWIRQGGVRVFTHLMADGRIAGLVLVPIQEGGAVRGAFLISGCMNSDLFGAVRSWSLPTRTGMVLLLHQRELPEVLRSDSGGEDPTDGNAGSGSELVYLRDETGQDIVVCWGPLPGSDDCFLVVRQAVTEAFALWRERFWSLLTVFGGGGISLVLVMLVIWQREKKNHYCRLLEAQEAQRMEGQRHALILRSLEEGVIVLDVKGRVQSLNPKAERMTGWATGEARGRRLDVVYRLVDPQTGATLPSPIEQRLQGMEHAGSWSYKQLCAHGGETRMVADSLAVMRGEGDVPRGYVLVFWDITDRHVSETRMRESEERFRSLFDQSIDGIVLLESGGTVVTGNSAACKALDFEPKDFAGVDFQHLIEAQEVNRTVDLDEVGKPRHFETLLTRRDGSTFPADVQLSNVQFGGRSYSLVVFRDISQSKAAERALTESERRLSILLGNLRGMAYRCRMDPERTTLYVSPGAHELTGYTAEKLLNNTAVSFGSLIHPDDRAMVWEKVNRAFAGNHAFVLEYRIRTADGGIKWVMEQGIAVDRGDPPVLEGFITDITRGYQDHMELELLRKAIEYAEDMVVLTDERAVILYVNPSFERTTGYAETEVLGNNPRLLQSGQHGPEFYEEMWRTLTSGRVWQGRMVNRKKNGEHYTEMATISPVFGAGGAICHYIAVKRDVTQEQRAEEQLRQAQKMEALGQLAGGIAHDFNNILQVIQSCNGLLMERVAEKSEELEYSREIGRASHRAAELTRQMLALGRQQILEKQTLDLNGLVGNMGRIIGRVLHENIELEVRLQEEPLWVFADPGQLEQVLMNLCVNARDAMSEGGRLILETGLREVPPGSEEVQGAATAGMYALLRVIDSGHGMDENTQGQIFNPFFTTKEVGRGSGLGLAMTYGIVKQHNGAIHVESAPGKGTRFEILLPLAGKGQSEKRPPDATAGAATRGSERILLVEDDEVVRRLTAGLLRRAGYTVETAANGEEAIKRLERDGFSYDLLLSDVVMPKAGGHAVWKMLRRVQPRARVLMMSGHATATFDEAELRALRSSFLSKPFSPETLLEKVRELLDRPEVEPLRSGEG